MRAEPALEYFEFPPVGRDAGVADVLFGRLHAHAAISPYHRYGIRVRTLEQAEDRDVKNLGDPAQCLEAGIADAAFNLADEPGGQVTGLGQRGERQAAGGPDVAYALTDRPTGLVFITSHTAILTDCAVTVNALVEPPPGPVRRRGLPLPVSQVHAGIRATGSLTADPARINLISI